MSHFALRWDIIPHLGKGSRGTRLNRAPPARDLAPPAALPGEPASSTVWRFTPVALPPGRLRLATRPIATRSVPIAKTIGIVIGRGFGSERRWRAARRGYHCHPPADQIGGQVRQPIILSRRPAEFDRHILTFDIARLA